MVVKAYTATVALEMLRVAIFKAGMGTCTVRAGHLPILQAVITLLLSLGA